MYRLLDNSHCQEKFWCSQNIPTNSPDEIGMSLYIVFSCEYQAQGELIISDFLSAFISIGRCEKKLIG